MSRFRRRRYPKPSAHGAMLGTLVYDELIVPIVGIRLLDTAVVFEGLLPGPLMSYAAKGVRVFSPEGGLIFNAPDVGVNWESVSIGGCLHVFQPLEVTGQYCTTPTKGDT